MCVNSTHMWRHYCRSEYCDEHAINTSKTWMHRVTWWTRLSPICTARVQSYVRVGVCVFVRTLYCMPSLNDGTSASKMVSLWLAAAFTHYAPHIYIQYIRHTPFLCDCRWVPVSVWVCWICSLSLESLAIPSSTDTESEDSEENSTEAKAKLKDLLDVSCLCYIVIQWRCNPMTVHVFICDYNYTQRLMIVLVFCAGYCCCEQ